MIQFLMLCWKVLNGKNDNHIYKMHFKSCSKGCVGNTPITYRIQTGYNESTYKPIYTFAKLPKDK